MQRVLDMATGKPRITITLEPEQYEVISRLATLQRGSMSRIVSELLAEVTPMLEKVCDTMAIAAKANDEMKARIFKSCQEAEADMRPLVEAVTNQLDIFADELRTASGEGAGAADTSAAGGEADNPRPVTRGSRNPKRAQTSQKVMR